MGWLLLQPELMAPGMPLHLLAVSRQLVFAELASLLDPCPLLPLELSPPAESQKNPLPPLLMLLPVEALHVPQARTSLALQQC